jgi:hypothetical protein
LCRTRGGSGRCRISGSDNACLSFEDDPCAAPRVETESDRPNGDGRDRSTYDDENIKLPPNQMT